MPHGHTLAVATLLASYLSVIFFVRDVIGAAYSNRPGVSGLRQSLGG